MAKSILDAEHFDYKVVDAEDNADLSRQYDIKQAPTLVIVDASSVVTKYSNVSNIKKFVKG